MEINGQKIKLGPQYCSAEELTSALAKVEEIFNGESYTVGCQVSTATATLVMGLMSVPANTRLIVLEQLLNDFAALTIRARAESAMLELPVGQTIH